MNLTEFLLARIAEDEAVARGAIQDTRPGAHWQWVTNDTDTPVAPGDLADAQQHQTVSLRTVEEFDTYSVGKLPGFLTSTAYEVDPGAGEHIARHDPARVLAECEAKRRIVEREESRLRSEWRRYSDEHRQSYEEWLRPPRGEVLRLLALPYADHPDYDPAWRP